MKQDTAAGMGGMGSSGMGGMGATRTLEAPAMGGMGGGMGSMGGGMGGMASSADSASAPLSKTPAAGLNVVAGDPHKAFGVTPYMTSVEQYKAFRRDGFLIVRGLINAAEIAELRQHTDDLMQGRLPEQQRNRMEMRDVSQDTGTSGQGLESPPEHLSPEQKAEFFLRIHMLHRKLALHEKYMLHPRVIDVLEVLIGPDILAMQTMLFLKGPGKPGQGWHQDSYYIPTHPDTLCGAWICIDDCDEFNGAMWFAKGSGHEPVYPPTGGYGFGTTEIAGIQRVGNVSNEDDSKNDLTPIADRYDHSLAIMKAGDVAFFNGHVLHRSKKNMSKDRFRRSFVGHYCNARSFTQWGADSSKFDDVHASPTIDPVTRATNGSHILARGDTHLTFAKPAFGTPCAALLPKEQRKRETGHAAAMMGNPQSGMMGSMDSKPDLEDDDD